MLSSSDVWSVIAQTRAPIAAQQHRCVSPRLSADIVVDVDVVVIGGGPAGYTAAALLAERSASVALIDLNGADAPWPNNYGAWASEWDAVVDRLQMPELLDATLNRWQHTHCYLEDSSSRPPISLDAPYIQIDRSYLKQALKRRMLAGGATTIIRAKVAAEDIAHDLTGSSLRLSDGQHIRAKVLLDATGFESKLVTRQSAAASGWWRERTPYFQYAYGCVHEVASSSRGGYDPDAMTLFDFRSCATEGEGEGEGEGAPRERASAFSTRPSFLYVMPLGEGRYFFEETQLISTAAERLTFRELRLRLHSRLDEIGVTLQARDAGDGTGGVGGEEEEYSYIPMGGHLPDPTQRIIAIGGAGGLVHPATGYQMMRMMTSTADVADAISEALNGRSTGESTDHFDAATTASAAYRALWPAPAVLQREFQLFGGLLLARLDAPQTAAFFEAFFSLPVDVWRGFLAGRAALPGNEHHDTWHARAAFAVAMLWRLPVDVGAVLLSTMVSYVLDFGPSLLRCMISSGEGDDADLARGREGAPTGACSGPSGPIASDHVAGDMLAKIEAYTLIQEAMAGHESAADAAERTSPQVAEAGSSVV